MPRDKYSRSPSRSKKSKRSKSRDRDRDRHRDYDKDYDRRHKKSSKSSRSKDYSPDNRRKRDRYRRRSSSQSDSSSSSPSHSSSRSSSRYKPSSKPENRSRSKSTGPVPPPPPIISERFNFQDAVGVLDNNQVTAADIDKNEFTPQSFSSTAKKLPEKVKIDLDMGTIELPPMPNQEEEEDTLFNPKFFGDERERMQRWVRKMMVYRQPRMETN